MKRVKSTVKSPNPVTSAPRNGSSMSRKNASSTSRLNHSSTSMRKLKTPTVLKSLELVKTDITMTDATPIVDIRAGSPKFGQVDKTTSVK